MRLVYEYLLAVLLHPKIKMLIVGLVIAIASQISTDIVDWWNELGAVTD
jgi:hypothetical protein